MLTKNYRPTKAERRKMWEYIAIAADGAESTEDMELFEIEEAMTEALYDMWADGDWNEIADYVPWISDEFDGKTIPAEAREAALL